MTGDEYNEIIGDIRAEERRQIAAAELRARWLEIGLAQRCGHCWTPLTRENHAVWGMADITITTCPTCDGRDWRDDA